MHKNPKICAHRFIWKSFTHHKQLFVYVQILQVNTKKTKYIENNIKPIFKVS